MKDYTDYGGGSETLVGDYAYTYDVSNLRIAKSVDADGEGVGAAEITRFVYDGQQIALQFDNTTLSHRYLYGPGIDQVLADENLTGTPTLYWALADHLGSVRELVTAAGLIVKHVSYDAFGNVLVDSAPSIEFLFGFTGRDRDLETGLQYNRARYLDPAMGRWIGQDPIGFAGGQLNLYVYVGNGPTYATDPSGLILVAVDGTSSRAFLNGPRAHAPNGHWNSHTRNFYGDYVTNAAQGRKAYWHGPDDMVWGTGSGAIADAAFQWLQNEWVSNNCQQPIDLVGHSRGGAIVMVVAWRIQTQGFVDHAGNKHSPKVRFLGLLDPVDMSTEIQIPGELVPANVLHTARIYASAPHGGVRSRAYFNRVDGGLQNAAATHDNVLKVNATHAAIGGAPWQGDQNDLPWLTVIDDISGAYQSDHFLRHVAMTAGVDFTDSHRAGGWTTTRLWQ